MYKVDTARNTELTELLSMAFVVEKGWMCSQSGNRDSPYDLIADFGNGDFQRIQVKKLSSRGDIKRVINRSNQKVTLNGKIRNSSDYASEGIEWLFAVCVSTKKIYTYHINSYKNMPVSITVDKQIQDEFPENELVRKNTDFGIRPQKDENQKSMDDESKTSQSNLTLFELLKD